MDPDDLTEAERDAFRTLSRDRSPRRALEDTIVASLRTRGHLDDPRAGRWMLPALAVAASIVIAFGLGVRAGAARATATPAGAPAAPAGPQFVLLLYEGPGFENPAPGRESDRATEYRGWANGLGRGRISGGNELAATASVLPEGVRPAEGAGSAERDVRGYFIISAPDAAAAAAIARTCPHLKYGGVIAVKPVIEH